MPGSRSAGSLLLAVAVAAAGLCPSCSVASPAPTSARLTMEAAQRDPHGAWINLTTDRGGVAGELLAVEPRAVIVQSSAGFQRVPIGAIRSWSLAWYEADNSSVIGLNVLGTLSTISHGFWLVFTAPLLWMIPGTAMARAQSRQGYESGEIADPTAMASLAMYARFPAGLPPGFDPTVPPAEGGLDQPCYPNQTCNRGLTCDRAVCRPAAPAPVAPAPATPPRPPPPPGSPPPASGPP